MSAFDLSDSMTRVLTCSGLVAGGAVVATVAPAGIAAGAALALCNMAGGILAADLHGETLGRLGKSSNLLKNHDLTKLTGAAIRISLKQLADSKDHSLDRKEKKSIKAVGKFLESRWEGLAEKPEWEVDVPLVQGCEIGSLLATKESTQETTALEPETWQTLLRAHAEMGKIELSVATAKLGAEHLYLHFSHAVWELLKEDAVGKGPSGGRAYAALQMTMLGTIQSRLPSAAQRDAESADLAKQLNEAITKEFLAIKEELGEADKERHAELIEWIETAHGDVSAKLGNLQTTADANLRETALLRKALEQLILRYDEEAKARQENEKSLRQKDLLIEDLQSQLANRNLMLEAFEAVTDAAIRGDEESRIAVLSGDPSQVLAARASLRNKCASQLASLRKWKNKADDVENRLVQEIIEADRQLSADAYLRGDIDEAKRRLENILAERPNDLNAINQTGHIYRLRGDLPAAEASYKRLLELAKDNSGVHATAYGNLGSIYRTRGDLDQAETMHEKALAINEEQGRKNGMANQYGNLGVIYQTRGDLDQAEKMHEKSLAINEELGCKNGMANQYGNLGLIYKTQGDLDQAERMLKKSLAIKDKLGDKQGMACAYANLGSIYRIRGDFDQAETMHEKSLAINEELGHKQGMASNYANLGSTYLTQGDLDRAETMLKKSLAINEKLGHKEGMANQYGNHGVIYLTQGDLDQAETTLKKALAINEELGHKEGIASDYANLGLIYRARGDLDQAETMLKKALAINEELGHREGMASDYANLGSTYRTRGDLDQAQLLGNKARDLFSEVGMPHRVKMMQEWLDSLLPESVG